MEGLRDSVVQFHAEINGTSNKDIMDLLVSYYHTVL